MPYQRSLAIMVALAAISSAEAHGHGPRVSVGFNFGPSCRPWCHCPPSFIYYRPAPIYYVEPAPRVIVQPAPVIVQPAPAVTSAPVYQSNNTLPPPPAIQPAVALREPTHLDTGIIGRNLEMLKSPDVSVRCDAVMELGRTKSDQAVAPLSATLAGDSNPEVRDAAARALGLIAAPSALPALRYAAQSDSDRDVRRSSQFAVEIIQTNLRNR